MTKDEQIKMLKEQRAVLRASNEKFRKGFIDKACGWLDNTLPNIEYITNASALRQTKKQYIESFRRAMEKAERRVTIES